jgi:hypothetical protein
MRSLLSVILLCAFAVWGCARRKISDSVPLPAPRAGAPASIQALIVTPENELAGKVAMVNTAGRFVVLNFPLGKMAAVGQRLNLYRRGLKVGEVKVTGPQREDNIVADLVAGDAEVGDAARGQ